MEGDILKATVSIERRIYYNEEGAFGIFLASIDKVTEGKPILSRKDEITLKGTAPKLNVGDKYKIVAKEVKDAKYGTQYQIQNIFSSIVIEKGDSVGQKKYLLRLFTEKQVQAMYDALSDPFDSLYNRRMEDLVQVKGVGINTAQRMVDKFAKEYSYGQIYLQLEEYGLTDNMITKLVDTYVSPDLVIEKVKDNPYLLASEVDGVGFAKADQIALSGGFEEHGVKRVSAFIKYYLAERAVNGFSWIESQELIDAIVENLGEDIPDEPITESIHALEGKLWWSEDKQRIGLRQYKNLEDKIAKELIRIRDAKSDFNYDGWEKIVEKIEEKNGWKYTDQQKLGIKMVLENNIVCIHGLAGTGKSTIVNAMMQVLKGYDVAQVALSGRAAARLGEVTGEEGSTIHRLLKFPSSDKEAKNKFYYHDKNPLPYDIIIVDEISMIGGYLFYYLLRAIKSGAKVVLLGDIGQLESIGECNVAKDIIESPEIPTTYLDKIHRQAQASAIITESIKMRHGEQIVSKEWTGEETRGELQDFTIDCYSDKNNTFFKCMQYFSSFLGVADNIFDVQILAPMKERGDACTWNLNQSAQELYNPASPKKKEIVVKYTKERVGILRVGDKVINTKNNYKTFSADTYEKTPIFNGNLGIIYDITDDGVMLIDFLDIGRVIVARDHVKAIELGYAITVHKSQGSQFKYVIFGIDYSSYSLLTREILYTGVTRAQKKCVLTAQTQALRYSVMQESVSQKQTHLQQSLYEVAHPKLVF